MLAVLGSGVLVAQAAKSTKTKAAKSQQMKVACAGENGVLRYVSRASKCKGSEKVVNFDVNNPIDACVKLHGTQNGVRGSLSQLRAARLPAGTTRLSPPADCPAKVQPNEIGITLPGPKKQWFCARKSDGRLRWVSKASKCDKKRELAIWVPQGSPRTPTPETPAGQGNGNKSPKGSDDSVATDKDAPIAIDVLSNDTDADGDPLSVESVNTNGTTGTVTPNPNGTITYDPAGKFDNLKPGQNAFDNFKYKVQDNHGGHSGETRVDVRIQGKNLSPKAVNDSSSTDEASATNVNVLANDTDAEGDSLTLGPIDQTGTQGTVTTGPGNTLHYDPNNQFEDLAVGETRLDTFKYRANDGNSNSAPATVTMTVTGVNDAPTLDTTNSSAAYSEDGPAVPVDGGVALDDVDGDQIAGATVTISTNFASADGDTLGFTNQNGITGSYNSGTGVLTLTGNASVANYETALRSITFSNTSNTPSTLTRTVSFKAKDQHNADTNTDTRDVTVAATNDAPVNAVPAAGALDVGEDGNVTSNGFSISDTDAGSGAMQTELKVLHGTLDVAAGGTLTGNGTATVKIEGTQTQISTSLASVKYTPASDFAGSDTLTIDTSDLGHNPAPAQTDSDNYAISVSAVNDAPVLTSPASATTDEDVTKSFSAGDVSIADVDSSTDDITATLAASHGKLALGDLTGLTSNTGNGTGSVSLTGPRTEVNQALDGLSYTPDADYNGPDTISVGVDDLGHNGSGGGLTDSASISVTISAVNDAPVSHVPGAQIFDEDTSRTFSVANGNSLSISDVDLASGSAISDLKVDHGTLTVNGTPNGLTGNGTGHVTFTDTQSSTASALNGLVYTPNANFAGTDTLTYKTDDQGQTGSGGAKTDTETVTLNVSALNDAPATSVPSATQAVDEDGAFAFHPVAGNAITVSDVDADPGNVRLTFATSHGNLTFPDTTGLTFSGGTNGTHSFSVEGTVSTLNARLAGLQYAPDANYSGLDTISVDTSDLGNTGSGGPLTDSDSINVTVGSVNDPPTVDTTDTDATFTEAQPGAIEIDPGVTVADVDDTNIESATVKITAGHQSTDVLDLPSPPSGVTVTFTSGSDTLTITGTKTLAEYQAMLQDVTFFTPSNSPGASRTVRFTVNDGTDDSPATNATRDIDITNTNDAPVIGNVSGTVSYAEDGPAATLDNDATVTDNDTPSLTGGGRVEITNDQPGDVLEFTPQGSVNGSYSNGVLTITGSGTPAEYQAFLRSVTYKTTSDTPDTTDRTVEFQVDDGEPANHASNVATKTLQVSATNDRPTVSLPDTTPVAYTENDAATLVNAPGVVSVNDVDSLTISSATVSFSGGYLPEDVLDASPPSGLTRSFNTTTGVLTITGSGTFSEYEDALESVTYANTSNNPSTAQRTLEFVVNDGAAFNNLSTAATRRVNVTNVNDSPVLTQNDAGTLTYTEDSPSENHADPIVPNLGVSDSDDANLSGATVQFTAGYASAEDNLDFSNQNGITGNYNSGTGVLTLSGSSSVANYQTALRSIAYRNTSENPDTTQRTISFQVTDGHVGDNPLSNTVSRNIDVVRTNDAPVADDETFNGADSAVGNTTYVSRNTVATANNPADGAPPTPDPTDVSPVSDRPHKTITGDILAGDTDVDSAASGLTVTSGTFGTDNGGMVTIQSDGDFTFEPKATASCSDPSDGFNYTLNDGGSPNGTDTGHVTIALAGCVWYVNNGDVDGNDGTSEKPFDSLAQAETSSAANHSIFVYDGNDTSVGYANGINLKSGQKLIGEAAALTVGSDTLHSADSNNKPTITDNNADVVDLDDGNEVKGFNIDPQGTGGGIAGSSGDTGGGTIDDVNIDDQGVAGTQPALELDSTTGTFNISNLVIKSKSTGVRLHNTTTPANDVSAVFAPTSQISINSNGAPGLDIDGTSAHKVNLGSSTFDDITVTNSSTGGVDLNNATGTAIALGDGSNLPGTVGDLNLTTTSGATPAFRVVDSTNVSVGSAATDNVSATGGPAIDVTGSTTPNLDFDDVDSTNSAGDGVNIDGLGTGQFTAASGDLGGYAGTAFDLNGGSGTVTYTGNLNNGNNTAGSRNADITGRTGGAVTFDGQITDGSGAGGGITMSANTAGSTTFSNSTKTLNTGAGDAVNISNPDGSTHAVTFSNGGLNIDTTSGAGLTANGVASGTPDGTLLVTGSGNTIDTTSGKGLNVSNVSVGATPLTLEHISGDGTNAGILLNNTGTNDALSVSSTGSGTCTAADQSGCTGGVIKNTTGADSSATTPPGTGVVLSSTKGVALSRMNLKDNSNYAIRGNSVNGFTLANSVVNGTNGTNENAPFEEGSVSFDNLTGAAAVNDSVISGGRTHGVRVENNTGTLNRLVFDSTDISTPTTAPAQDALNLESVAGAATFNATVQNGSSFDARADMLDFQNNGTNGDLIVTNSDFNNSVPQASQTNGGGGVTASGGSDTTMTWTGNTFSNTIGTGVLLLRTAQATPHTLTGTFSGNTIGIAATANSGSRDGDALKIQNSGGGGRLNMTVQNNNIFQYDESAIDVTAGNGNLTNTGNTNVTATGNTLSNPGTGTADLKHGILLNIGTGGLGSNDAQCLSATITSNNIQASGKDSVPASGATDPVTASPNLDFNLRSRGDSVIRLPGLTGDVTNMTNVRNFFSANNAVGGAPDGLARRDTAAPTADYSASAATC